MKRYLSFVLLSGSFLVGSTTSVHAFIGGQKSFNKKVQTQFLQDDQIKRMAQAASEKRNLEIIQNYTMDSTMSVASKAFVHSSGLKDAALSFLLLCVALGPSLWLRFSRRKSYSQKTNPI